MFLPHFKSRNLWITQLPQLNLLLISYLFTGCSPTPSTTATSPLPCPSPWVSPTYTASYLQQDGTAVYWVDRDSVTASIARRLKTGEAPQTLVTGEESVTNLAVNQTHIYWSAPIAVSGPIKRALKDGSSSPEPIASPLAGCSSNCPYPSGGALGLNSNYVFWGAGGDSFRIASVPLAGGSITTYGNSISVPYSLFVDDTELFFPGGVTTSKGITRYPLPTPTSSPSTLPTEFSTESGITSQQILGDSEYIYYSMLTNSEGGIYKRLRTGGDPILLASAFTTNMTLYQNTILYTVSSISTGTDTLYELSKSGGTPVAIAACPMSGTSYFSGGIVADIRAIYLTTSASSDSRNLILKLDKNYTEVVPP